MFIEGIYPDYENAKVRYFIFDDTEISKENRNRVFVGTLLSQSEQKIVQDYLNSFRSTGFLTEQANFLVFFLRKITILWGWVFLAMARCQ